jgi:ferredoxin
VTTEVTSTRYDGRDTLFARLDLVPGTARYDEYYERHPESKQSDDALRDRGGLLRLIVGGGLRIEELRSLKAHHSEAARVLNLLSDDDLAQALMDDSSATIEDYARADLARTPAARQVKLPPGEMTALIKDVARLYGASIVGIAETESSDYYSHRRNGEQVTRHFRYAIVFAVEMNRRLINRAPHRPTLLATCNGYVDAARVGARLSGYIKSLGYDTSLSSMVRYDVPLVPLAEKAGLGQRGRCHFLVTREFGNRVRLGAVLTDMPLIPDTPADFGLTEFCALCGKCAVNCPSKALSGQPEIINDRPRWRFDEAKCFTMWTEFATDCALCIASCPLSQCPDPAKVAVMKDQPDLMWDILREDRDRQGARSS